MITPLIRPSTTVGQRRSQRILLSMPIIVSGEPGIEAAFSERTTTLVVSAHGALLLLRQSVRIGQPVSLKNKVTGEEQMCLVVDINPGQGEACEVGVEFAEPCPRFWRVSFPPTDWSPRDPEAKRFVSSADSTPRKPPSVKK